MEKGYSKAEYANVFVFMKLTETGKKKHVILQTKNITSKKYIRDIFCNFPK